MFELGGSSIFDYSVDDAHGNAIPLSTYSHNKVILIVNTASYCGYTKSNYEQLQSIYTRLHDKG
jgi:glutathione peroxidase